MNMPTVENITPSKNSTNNNKATSPSLPLYWTFSPISLIGLGALLLILGVWVGRLGTTDFGDLWPEYLVAFYLLIIGFVALTRWEKSNKEGFLVKRLSPNPRLIIRYSPIIAGFVIWMIATAVARSEDSVKWGDIVPEILGSIALFAVGGFLVLKG